MKRLLINKGSALVWALCAMMVLTLVVASILAVATKNFRDSLAGAAQRKAELLAESGANYAVAVLTDQFVDADEWLPLTYRDYNESTGKFIEASVPKKIYFDDSVRTTLEEWLSSSRYRDVGELVGTDIFVDGEPVLTDVEKAEIMKSNTSPNYAELFFSVEKVGNDEEGITYVLKVTSFAKNGTNSASCGAVFKGTVFIDDREVDSVWDFIGFTES